MNEAKKRKFDVLMVWKLDRLSRSMKDLVMILNELGDLGIDLVSHAITSIPPRRQARSWDGRY
jgi:DNA invertase Pin-like site-specific DNA recombinase